MMEAGTVPVNEPGTAVVFSPRFDRKAYDSFNGDVSVIRRDGPGLVGTASVEAYVRLREVDGRPRLDGQARCLLGVPVPPSRPGAPRQGVFAEWDWDGQRLVVRNDRYGFYPLYYFRGRDEVAVSPSIATLIERGAPPEIDDDALGVFLRLQSFVGDETPFRRIRLLPPSAELVWSTSGFALRSQHPEVAPARIGRREAVAGYIELFRQAVRRRLSLETGRRLVLPLSGGQDSRHILLELVAQGRPPLECVTVAPSWSPKLQDDARVAAEVAATAQVAHTILDQDRSLFDLERTKNVWTSFSSTEHAWILPLEEFLRPAQALVFDGIAGDILSSGLYIEEDLLALFREGAFEALAERYLGDEAGPRAALGARFLARASRACAVERLAVELERHAGAANPIAQFVFWTRTRRSIAVSPYAILNRVAAVDSPFLDHDLYDFLASLPPEIIIDRTFHAEVIRGAHPRFAEVPFARNLSPGANRPGPFAEFARRLSRSWVGRRDPTGARLRGSYLLPRLARSVLQPRYARESAWLLNLATYLAQIQTLATEGAGSPAFGSAGPDPSSRS